jgi:hypothetical protein
MVIFCNALLLLDLYNIMHFILNIQVSIDIRVYFFVVKSILFLSYIPIESSHQIYKLNYELKFGKKLLNSPGRIGKPGSMGPLLRVPVMYVCVFLKFGFFDVHDWKFAKM